jgi:hypothetical protein
MARPPLNRPQAKRPRKGVLIAGILAVLGGVVYHFAKAPPRSIASGSTPAQATNPDISNAGYKATLPDLEVNWKGGMSRDLFDIKELTPSPKIVEMIPQSQPTTPDFRLAVAAEAKSKIRLQGILNGSTPTALINGNTYNPGDRISGFVILEILDNQIIVERQGVRLSIISE